jgi:ferric-dicitrate binding protein FerR (iron transport regulator)
MENHKDSSTDYNGMIVNYLTGSISREELELLIKWINTCDENRQLFHEKRMAWIFAGLKNGNRKKDTDRAFERLLLKRDAGTPRTDHKMSLTSYLRMAATWLIFVVVGSGITMMVLRKNDYQYRNAVKISVPLGAKSCITLPDGTRAWLNAGTELTYNEDYGQKKRTLFLTGEAFFDVAKDKEHPFIVNTSDVIIQALGTQFNVKAYPEEKTITTTLVEGKIDVRIINSHRQLKKVTLLPNEEIVYFVPGYQQKIETGSITEENLVPEAISRIKTREVQVISNVDAKSSTSWKDDRWIIDRQPLGYLVPLLERRYNLKIVFKDDELKRYNFTGIIQNETAEQIMNALCLTAPLSYLVSNDTIVLSLNMRDKDHFNKIMKPKN